VNISGGNGFSFNTGEPSYGVTSSVWVLILSLSGIVLSDIFWLAKILDFICAVFSVFFFFRLAKKFFKSEYPALPYMAAFVFIMNVWFVRWTFTGMETSFAVLLAVLIFHLFYQRRFFQMFFLLGIFFLVRPESLVLFLLMLGLVFREEKLDGKPVFFRFAKYLIAFSVIVVPFLIYSKLTFGAYLPNTISGKSTMTINLEIIIVQIKEIFSTLISSSLLELILSLIVIFLMIKKKSWLNTLPFTTWITSLILLYVITDADIISRYLLIISPFLILFGLKLFEFMPFRNIKLYFAAILFFALYSQFIFYKFVKPGTDDFTTGVNTCFIPLAEWLKENTSPDSRILANDVGVIGYYSDRYIIDAAALINRDLNLNREIMNMPVEERQSAYKLLKFAEADYVIERDSSDEISLKNYGKYFFEFQTMKKFPRLGISDPLPKYYKIYKVTKAR
jgi:hypothetical protein